LFLVAERQELRGVSGETMAEPALVARGPAKRGDDFVEAARGLVVATMLAALAGMVDVIGYLHLKGLFVSFMSGNSTQLAAALGRGDLGVMLHNAVRIKAESDFALRLGLERGPDVHTAGIESGEERFLVPVLTYMTSDGVISATPDLNWPPAQSVVSVISTFDYEHGNGNMSGAPTFVAQDFPVAAIACAIGDAATATSLHETHLSFPKAFFRAICGISITLRQKVTDSVPLCVRCWYLQFAPR
jgi:hypothetical protein